MRMTAVIDPTGTLALDLEGEKTTSPYGSVMDARRFVMSTATELAVETSTATELHIEDPSGSRTILVQTDGDIVEQPAQNEPAQSLGTIETAPAPSVTSAGPEVAVEVPPTAAVAASARVEAPAATTPPVATATTTPEVIAQSVPAEREKVAAVEALPTRRSSMPSFVDRPDTDSPAQLGVRGLLNQFGFKLAPSTDELAQRKDEKLVSQHWAGPRTIAVLNPKGGVGKTPTEVCLSAVFARLGGSGVLAWDNNNSLGSLGWRTYDAGHGATVVKLLGQTDYFMTSDARVGDLASYVHHQPADQYDVLRSDDRSDAKTRHEVTGAEVYRLHAVAAKYYRLILMDSGNTERGDNWEAMIHHTDQVVIPVKSVDDAAEGASRVLSALRTGDEHTQALADRAVVIVLGAEPSHGKAKLDKLADDFRPFVKAVTTVPYDPALVEGRIRFSAMLPRTRRAWLRAAALIAEEL
jgi:MinD-like ATPase involved in chromosome partitioning or flagellar assembly